MQWKKLVLTPTASAQLQRQRNSATGRLETYQSHQGRIDCQIMEIESARSVAACSDSDSKSFARDVHEVVPLMAGLAKRIAKALPDRNAPVVQGAPKTR